MTPVSTDRRTAHGCQTRFMSEPFVIVYLMFPNLTLLDLAGPAQVFSHLPHVEQHFVWHRLEPVPSDAGHAVLPTTTIDKAPQADLLFVPGGEGAFELFDDDIVLEFLRRQARGARYLTSVCTGVFPLAAAGLLTGRRVTTHWAWWDLLHHFDVVPVHERVVRDGSVVTGAGVTSGIDFALTVAAEIAGADVAKSRQLTLEYAPQPPFDAGAPDRPDADPEQVSRAVSAMRARWEPAVTAAAERVRRAAG